MAVCAMLFSSSEVKLFAHVVLVTIVSVSILSTFTARRVCRSKMSVRLSVRTSHAGIVCKRLYISIKLFTIE